MVLGMRRHGGWRASAGDDGRVCLVLVEAQ